MRIEAFDFNLPEALIALRPAVPREEARLLVIRPDGAFEDAHIRDLPQLLRQGDLLVANDSRVVAARLFATRPPRADGPAVAVEVLLHRALGDGRYNALARPGKRLKTGDQLRFEGGLTARVVDKLYDGEINLVFDRSGAALDAALGVAGVMPLPPYIASKRAADARDSTDYQTFFANRPGSVAAPTAGLHLTPELIAAARAQGIDFETLTLHVGLGTFLPVSAADTADHRMHAEHAMVSEALAARLNARRAAGGRIVSVGTTALRSLESAAAGGTIQAFDAETDIFITPGHTFRTAEVLLTNFHLPKSTLFMLVSAFAGLERMQAAYAAAIARAYRFFSYGDACLIFRQP